MSDKEIFYLIHSTKETFKMDKQGIFDKGLFINYVQHFWQIYDPLPPPQGSFDLFTYTL